MWTLLRRNLPRTFLKRSETAKLMERIHTFEEKTGCELVFHFRRSLGETPLEKNRQLFKKYRLDQTSDRRGILITLATVQKKYAIWVDDGISKYTGEEFWQKIGDKLGSDLKHGHHLQALLNAVDLADRLLAEAKLTKQSPRAGHGNELPDAPIIEEDGDEDV